MFDVYARLRYITARVAGPLAQRIDATLRDPNAARVGVLMGHDTNIAALVALLGVTVAPPGGALMIEVLRDRAGTSWARLSVQAATPEQIRYLQPLSTMYQLGRQTLVIPGCRAGANISAEPDLCPLPTLLRLIEAHTTG